MRFFVDDDPRVQNLMRTGYADGRDGGDNDVDYLKEQENAPDWATERREQDA